MLGLPAWPRTSNLTATVISGYSTSSTSPTFFLNSACYYGRFSLLTLSAQASCFYGEFICLANFQGHQLTSQRGFIATVQAGVHSWNGEMALRFFLGAFEAWYA